MLKKVNKFIIMFIFMFAFILNINAALPNTLNLIDEVSGSWVCSGNSSGLYECDSYGMALKIGKVGSNTGEDVPVICTKYRSKSPATRVEKCNLISNDWTAEISYGVATIINVAKDSIKTTNMTPAYFAAEMAINQFLFNKTNGVGGENVTRSIGIYNELYNSYLKAANDAYNNYKNDSKVNISLSSNNLTFTKDGNNYVSNTIEITSDGIGYSINTNLGTIKQTNNKFQVVVPVNSVKDVTEVKVTITDKNFIHQAKNYECGTFIDTGDHDGDNDTTEVLPYQTLTPLLTEEKLISTTKEISGTIKPNAKLIINKVDGNNTPLSGATIIVTGTKGYNKEFKTDGNSIVIEDLEYDTYTIKETSAPVGYALAKQETVKLSESNLTATINIVNVNTQVSISKTDITGTNELAGATLEIQDKDGNIVKYCTDSNGNKNTECKWVSTTTPYVITGLPIGVYYLVETNAPEGYQINTEKIKFELTNNDYIKAVKMQNKLTKVVISKTDVTGTNELVGATLEIQDKDGNIVKYCTDSEGNKNTECKWISTENSYEIEGMPYGTYYLVETNAPDGYQLNKEKVKFELSSKEPEKTVKMQNKLTKVVISKVNKEDKKLLKGATLEIQDKDGNIVKYCTDSEGNKNTECKWVSTENSYEIEGMPYGVYYLVETNAPEGYQLNKDKIEFILDSKDSDVEITMENQLEVKVPDTLSGRSALLITISMFDIALGIGILTYVKKHRIEEGN